MTMVAMVMTGMGAIFCHNNDATLHVTPTHHDNSNTIR